MATRVDPKLAHFRELSESILVAAARGGAFNQTSPQLGQWVAEQSHMAAMKLNQLLKAEPETQSESPTTPSKHVEIIEGDFDGDVPAGVTVMLWASCWYYCTGVGAPHSYVGVTHHIVLPEMK